MPAIQPYLPQNMNRHGITYQAEELLSQFLSPDKTQVGQEQLVDPEQMEAAALALLETAHQNRYRWEDTSGTSWERAPRDVSGHVHAYSPTTSQPLGRMADLGGPRWFLVLTSTGSVYARNGGSWVQVDPDTGKVLMDAEAPFSGVEELEDLDPGEFPVYRLR